MVSGSGIQLCDSVSDLGEGCGNLLVSFQAWVMRVEGQGVLREPSVPRDQCAALNTYRGGVCVCKSMLLFSFIVSPGPTAEVTLQGRVCTQGHRWPHRLRAHSSRMKLMVEVVESWGLGDHCP